MSRTTRIADPSRRRGVATVTMLLLLLMTNLVVIGVVLRSAGEHELTVHRVETVQSFYATEAGTNMSIRELMLIDDEDGDGGIGSISDDGDDSNNPSVGGATVLVTRTYNNTIVAVEATGGIGGSQRRVRADVAIGERLEVDQVVVGNAWQTVNLAQAYHRPVVICTPRYVANTRPVVVRVSNVTRDSFDIRLQNPGDANPPVPDTVFYMVVEEGAWVVDDAQFEAQTYTSTVTDRKARWSGEIQSYDQAYTNPVVLGQVMTTNDPLWSVFWCRGSSRSRPPSSTDLRTGKHVAEDSTVVRAAEEIGFVVFERGHGNLGAFEFDAQLTADSIRGYTDSPPYLGFFSGPFGAPPAAHIATQAAMEGTDGGWVEIHGAGTTTTSVPLAIDEDQIGNSERNHPTEPVGILAFDVTGFHQGPKERVMVWAEVKPY